MRLDRFLSNLPRFSRADARLLLAAGRLKVDGATVRDARVEVREFSRIELDDELLELKRRTMQCHASQSDVQGMLAMPLEHFRAFFGVESYREPGLEQELSSRWLFA